MSYVRPFSQLRATDSAVAGGKGASLGELHAAGAPVPPGFVVLTSAWHRFLDEAGLRHRIEEHLAALTTERAAAVSAEVRQAVVAADVPHDVAAAIGGLLSALGLTRVAVRSSAAAEDGAGAAWAGQLDTFLDVAADDVVAQVRLCWASLFTERALVYRLESGGDRLDLDVAVVVQQMVEAEVAGVGFSVHPTTQEPHLMLIQAALGLGEAVVSGAVTPDAWVVCKRTRAIVERSVARQARALRGGVGSEPTWVELGREGERPALTDDQVLAYARILDDIEQHYGRPMDTEWALRDTLQVVQARPITTLTEGYDQAVYDTSVAWQPSYRRPFDLFASSLFAHNLDHTMLHAFGLPTFPMLFVELAPRLTQLCLVEAEHRRLDETVREACAREPARVRSMLARGRVATERILGYAARGEMPYRALEDALADFIEAVTYGSQIPIVVCDVLAADPDAELFRLASQNRARSAYPWLIDSVFPVLVRQRLAECGLDDLREPTRVVTIDDLTGAVDGGRVRARAAQVEAGRLHVYQRIDGRVQVSMLASTGFVMARLQGARVPRAGGDDGVIRGSAAYPGEVEGIARVILHPDAPQSEFHDGDVLVTVNANPSFLPFLRRCAAMVTDEGGASCHAAIVSRELKKPCVMGTGDATLRIPSGRRVRVDAFTQTVTLLDEGE